MATEALNTRPGLALCTHIIALDQNPAAPINVYDCPNAALERFLMNDMRMYWNQASSDQARGKEVYSLSSVNPGENKHRRLYQYEIPDCTPYDGNCEITICDDFTKVGTDDGYIEVCIDKCAAEGWQMDLKEAKGIYTANVTGGALDMSVAGRKTRKMRNVLRKIKRKINKDLITELYLCSGNYSTVEGSTKPAQDSLTDPKSLYIIKDACDINPLAMTEIGRDLSRANFEGEYIILAGEAVRTYFDFAQNRMSPEGSRGIDAAFQNVPWVYDKTLDACINGITGGTGSHILVVPKGAFGIDFWACHTEGSPTRRMHSHKGFATITDGGLEFDYEYLEPDCGHIVKELVAIYYGFQKIPAEVYCDGNNLIRHYLAECGKGDCPAFC